MRQSNHEHRETMKQFNLIGIPSGSYGAGNKTMKTGFTLVEILVSTFIIILLAGIIFANYRQSGQQLALQRSANKLALDFRRAQEMAMSAKECPTNVCGGPPAMIPPRYGIQFLIDTEDNQKKYIIFADQNNDGKYESGADYSNFIEEIFFENGIKISNLLAGDPPVNKTQIFITFKPPDPKVDIRTPADEEFLILRIQLINSNGQTKTVKVNKTGLIEIE